MHLLIPALLFVFTITRLEASDYDPLAIEGEPTSETLDLTVEDEKRDREIPILVYLPETTKPAPVVLFSHGLGGARTGCTYLGKHWSARGFVAVFLQHPGSDESVWKDVGIRERMAAMRKAASGQNYLARIGDVPAVLDQLEAWHKDSAHPLHGLLDLEHIGMSGHSFGAQTTQGVTGQWAPVIGQRYTDERLKASVIFSPGTPKRGDPQQAFGRVKIPWLLMTGTKDTAPIGGQTVESRLAVYPALPETVPRYQLVLHKAEHSAFTDHRLRGDTEPRNPNHHKAILALSTAFWDAYLKDNAEARAWLDGPGAKSILESEDRWNVGEVR